MLHKNLPLTPSMNPTAKTSVDSRNTLSILFSLAFTILRILRFKLRGYYFELSFKIDEFLFQPSNHETQQDDGKQKPD